MPAWVTWELGKRLWPVAVVLALVGAVWWHFHQDTVRVRDAYMAGRQAVLDSAKTQPEQVQAARAQLDTAKERHNGTRANVRGKIVTADSQAHTIEALVKQIPVAFDTLSAVVELRKLVAEHVVTITNLQAAWRADSVSFLAERAAVNQALQMDSTEMVNQRLIITRQGDRITVLEKRPTWLKTAVITVAGVAVGAAAVFFGGK